jgi:hypothetical protein
MCGGFQENEAMEVQGMVRALALVYTVGVEARQCQTLFFSFIPKLCVRPCWLPCLLWQYVLVCYLFSTCVCRLIVRRLKLRAEFPT